MQTITQVAQAMQTILGPVSNQMAEETGFCQRQSKVSGSVFMQTLVFSSLAHPAWSYTQLAMGARQAGVAVSAQGLEQRFSARSAQLAQRVLSQAVQRVIGSQPHAWPVLSRFAGVYVRDSTVIALPKALERVWPGSASSHGSSAGLKLHVRLELCGGQVAGPILAPGRAHDSRSPFQTEELPVGALRLGDLGFFALKQLAQDDRRGVFWLTRLKASTCLYALDGQPIALLPWLRQQTEGCVERQVLVGQHERLLARLIGERVPQAVAEHRRRRLKEYSRKKQTPLPQDLWDLAEWTLLLTNIPVALLSAREALLLLRVRWQIELLFKRWKSLFQLDTWRSQDPWRILTEIYAKLLAILIQHWCLLTATPHWSHPSFWKAALLVRQFAVPLAWAWHSLPDLIRLLALLQSSILALCHLNPRRSRPALYQLLERAACTTLA